MGKGFAFRLVLLASFAALAAGCSAPSRRHGQLRRGTFAGRVGFAIQAGAFSKAENAARLASSLSASGLEATYYKAQAGLFKVQIGNFKSREKASSEARRLKDSGKIGDYLVVSPQEFAVAHLGDRGENYLRRSLVETAAGFIGTPYLWGGQSAEKGFDCSGLVMTVYRLNGIEIPRNSGAQYDACGADKVHEPEEGDLVFFAPSSGSGVGHVGIYSGGGKFIHAPSAGKSIREDSLSISYFRVRYKGSCSCL